MVNKMEKLLSGAMHRNAFCKNRKYFCYAFWPSLKPTILFLHYCPYRNYLLIHSYLALKRNVRYTSSHYSKKDSVNPQVNRINEVLQRVFQIC